MLASLAAEECGKQRVLLLGVLMVLSMPSWVSAAPGDLDLSFGIDGVIEEAAGTRFRAVVVAAGGKLIAGGDIQDGSGISDFLMVRYDAQGHRDPSFGDGGLVRTPFGGGTVSAQVLALAALPGGRVLALGDWGDHLVLARYRADGSLDPAFGASGIVIGPKSADFAIGGTSRALAIRADGKILVAGGSPGFASAFAALRYLPDGSIDAGFGSGGLAKVAASSIGHAYIVRPLSDGKVLLGGGLPSADQFGIARLLENGDPDLAFGAQAVTTTPLDQGDGPSDLVLLENGILAVGPKFDPGAAPLNSTLALARFLSSGSPDVTFGSGGLEIPLGPANQLPRFSAAFAAASDAAGRVVIAGNFRDPALDGSGLARLTADGEFDVTFGEFGRVLNAALFSSEERGMVLQNDQGIVTVGYFDDGVTVHALVERRVGGSCGDGRLDAGEQCDDGNAAAGDGCTPQCRRAALEIPLVPTTSASAALLTALLGGSLLALRPRPRVRVGERGRRRRGGCESDPS